MKISISASSFLRIVCFLAVFGLALQYPASASITVTKTNSSGATVDGSSVNQSVNFSALDFAGMGSTITNVAVAVTFSKAPLFGVVLTPGFREIGFTLTGAGISEELIDGSGLSRSFNEGAIGASFAGTVNFDQNAATDVNANANQIFAGTFRPDDGDLSNFIGASGVGNWTLNISDSNAILSSGLTVSSWSVSITSVPEPASMGLWGMAAALGALIIFHRPRRETLRANS